MGQLAQSGARVDVLSASVSESAEAPASFDTLASVEVAATAASTGGAAASVSPSIAGPIVAGSRAFEPPSEDPASPTSPEPRQPAATKTTARSRKPLRGEPAAVLGRRSVQGLGPSPLRPQSPNRAALGLRRVVNVRPSRAQTCRQLEAEAMRIDGVGNDRSASPGSPTPQEIGHGHGHGYGRES